MSLRNAARLGIMLAVGSSLDLILNFLSQPYWILMTIIFVGQNGYNATRIRIQHWALGTVAGLVIAAGTLQFKIGNNVILIGMLFITLVYYLVLRKNYGLAMIGMTIVTVYTLQLLSLNGRHFLLLRLVDTLIGCSIAFCRTIWLWPQWHSEALRKNAHQALERDQEALRLLLKSKPIIPAPALAYARMRVNQAHNALFTSLRQAIQEPGFNARYLSDMYLWVTHSQFIVEHINAMTILVRDNYVITDKLAEDYLLSCEKALKGCQQRLQYESLSIDSEIIFNIHLTHDHSVSIMERYLHRILFHLGVMHTISSAAWCQRRQFSIHN